MAFVPVTPLLAPRHGMRTASLKSPRRACSRPPVVRVVAQLSPPQPPDNFTAPEPRTRFIRPDQLLNIASLSTGSLVRLGSGLFIEGYRVRPDRSEGGGDSGTSSRPVLREFSASLPEARPRLPLRVFEFEACPFCRKVREALTKLDLDTLFFPCPRNSALYRPYVIATGGKAQFPYLEDPNTGFAGYESDDIIRHLYRTYGPSDSAATPLLGPAAAVAAGLASVPRRGRGSMRSRKTVPVAKPLTLWAYEASPFCKLVREKLVELELPHLLRQTARGSPNRARLKDLVGRFQVPYLDDPNTGVAMFESAEIVEYLVATYGEAAEGAVEKPDEAQVFMPGDPLSGKVIVEKSLDPQPITDEKLEEYCEENPEADECRVYEE